MAPVSQGQHPPVTQARHIMGFAAFTVSAPDTERPVPLQESRRTFSRRLHWLLAGITETAAGSDRHNAEASDPAA